MCSKEDVADEDLVSWQDAAFLYTFGRLHFLFLRDILSYQRCSMLPREAIIYRVLNVEAQFELDLT